MDFVDWAQRAPLEIRFIEFMPFAGNAWDKKTMMPIKEILDVVKVKYPDLERLQGNKSDTAKVRIVITYTSNKSNTKILIL